MRRVGRPGLLGVAARTAVVAGTATAVSRGVSNKANQKEQAAAAQQQQEQQTQQQLAEQQQQIEQLQQAQQAPAQPAAPAAPAADGDTDLVAELQKLATLHTSGLLTDEEFAAAKAKLIS